MQQLEPYKSECPVQLPRVKVSFWLELEVQGYVWVRGPTAAMSMPPVTIKGYANVQDPGQHLRSCWCLRIRPPPGLYRLGWPAEPPQCCPGPSCSQGTMSESVAPLQMPVTSVTIKGCMCVGAGVRAAIWGHTGIQEPCYFWDQPDLRSLHYRPGSW